MIAILALVTALLLGGCAEENPYLVGQPAKLGEEVVLTMGSVVFTPEELPYLIEKVHYMEEIDEDGVMALANYGHRVGVGEEAEIIEVSEDGLVCKIKTLPSDWGELKEGVILYAHCYTFVD